MSHDGDQGRPPALGAWFGAGWVTKLASQTLYRVPAVLLALIAIVLKFGHDASASGAMLTGVAQMVAGVVASFAIGIVAALMGSLAAKS